MIGALLLAAQFVGPPAPEYGNPSDGSKTYPPVTIDLADRMAGHFARISLGSAADLFSTSAALHWCEGCRELNPGGWDAEARISLKLGAATLTAGGAWILERDGHSGWAKVLTWAFLLQSVFFAASNAIHAIRGY